MIEHWRIAAWIVRQAGLKGILFDPEPYSLPHAQFCYSAQAQRERHRFEEYYAKARSRGREVLRAVAEECPNIVLFCYFMDSVCAAPPARPIRARVSASMPTACIRPSSTAGSTPCRPRSPWSTAARCRISSTVRGKFLRAGQLIRGDCQELVSPENRAKYRAQVQVSFGIYLDAYWNPTDSPWHIDGLGGSRVARLGSQRGETPCTWPTNMSGFTASGSAGGRPPITEVQPQTWPEVLPHCDDIFASPRDPLGYARRLRWPSRRSSGQAGKLTRQRRLQHRGPGTIAVGLGDVAGGKVERLVGLGSQSRPRTGRIGPHGGGCRRMFLTKPRREAGTAVHCAGDAQDPRPGRDGVAYRWQTAAGNWTADALDRMFYAAGPRLPGASCSAWWRFPRKLVNC